MRTSNPFPFANTGDQKATEAELFDGGYYCEELFRWWTEHPYRLWTLRHLDPFVRNVGRLRVFEPACGCGVNLVNLAQHFPGWSLTGVDLSASGLDLARANIEGEFLQGDAEDLPFEDASFGLALCVAAAHHFADPRRFLFELVRVLVPGGLLYVFEPDRQLQISEELEAEAEKVKTRIREANRGVESAPKIHGPAPRAETESPFDRREVEEILGRLGMRVEASGHSEYLSEWARGYRDGFEHAAAFDTRVEGGTKYWAVWRKGA